MVRRGRRNVVYNKKKIIESIVKSEPSGRHTLAISNDTKLHRDTVFRLCKQLEEDDYIFRKNKQSEYHVTNKVYGYPELTAFSLGTHAMRTIYDIKRGWVSNLNEFCIDGTCKAMLRNNNNNITNAFEANRDRETLLEFATRLGAIIEYILIQALRPKKIFPNRDDLVDLDLEVDPIKGKDKDDISRRWVESAIKPTSILFEFCSLSNVKRGLAVFADKDKREYRDSSLSYDSRTKLTAKRKKMQKMNIDDSYWSQYEMDEANFQKLTTAFANTFPEIFEKLESIRRGLQDDIECNIRIAKEGTEKKRAVQFENDDPEYTNAMEN